MRDFGAFLEKFVRRKTALREAIQEFEKKGFRKLSNVGYWKAARRLEKAGKLAIQKAEQLYLLPSMDSLKINRGTIEPVNRDRVHSTHRILLSMPYSGEQPVRGATHVKTFGRYRTALQSVYRSGSVTVVAFKKKLNVWVHEPPGGRTPEQVLQAKVMGYRALRTFAQKHNIALEGYLERVLLSHHVVEDKALNDALKPIFEKYGEEIEARIGSKICQSTHPDKVEHEGKARQDRIVQGKDVASGLEYLTLDMPPKIETIERALSGFDEYNRNIKLHLEVLGEMRDTLGDIKKIARRGKK